MTGTDDWDTVLEGGHVRSAENGVSLTVGSSRAPWVHLKIDLYRASIPSAAKDLIWGDTDPSFVIPSEATNMFFVSRSV